MRATMSDCCAPGSFWATPSAAPARRPRSTRSSPARLSFLSIGCMLRARASDSISPSSSPGIWLGSLLASQLIARFSLNSICGRRQRGQRRGGGFVPRPLDRRPGDPFRNYRDDVRVQRRRGRGGARGPRQGDQREPARHRNGVRTLRFGSDGCRRRRWSCSPAGGRTRRSPPRPCSLPQALWRRRRSGSRETGAQPSPRRKARPRQKRRPDGLKRRVLRAGRGSRSGERLPWWAAPAREALWRPSGS